MILIDTNLLVFAHNIDSPHHKKANQLIKETLELKLEACIAHQNLLEFFSIITNSKRIENPISPQKAYELIEVYQQSKNIKKIYPSADTLTKTITISKKLGLSQAEIFDCYLAVTMEENGITTIYTDNISHFKTYPNIKAINPL